MAKQDNVKVIQSDALYRLVVQKLVAAGLPVHQAEEVSNHLIYADLCGIHSHGVVRVEYYAERISKGGVNLNPDLHFEVTGPCSGILHGDNGVGQYIVNETLPYIIQMAKEHGVAVVGISKISHSGALGYYVKKLAEQDLIAISMCQSDPMVVPFGGKEIYFGTNPIAFAAPRKDAEPIVFDMATTVQAWGKILDARSKNEVIPSDWAVDQEGNPTTDPYQVNALLPIAGAKGYGLMMMVDVLSGSLLGLPFGKHVSSMYANLSEMRDLGQFFIVIDPARFTDIDAFKERIDIMVEELHQIAPVQGNKPVYYPGEISKLCYHRYKKEGIPIPTDILDYLEDEVVHYNRFGNKDPFAT